MSTKLKLNAIYVEGERFFYSLSYDIDDFIGDGIWWLEIYSESLDIIYDKPFASSNFLFNRNLVRKKIKEIIQNEILYPKGLIK